MTTERASIAATAASMALPPLRSISIPAEAPQGWPAAIAAVCAMI
jgi:hypothetical protein